MSRQSSLTSRLDEVNAERVLDDNEYLTELLVELAARQSMSRQVSATRLQFGNDTSEEIS